MAMFVDCWFLGYIRFVNVSDFSFSKKTDSFEIIFVEDVNPLGSGGWGWGWGLLVNTTTTEPPPITSFHFSDSPITQSTTYVHLSELYHA